MRRGSIVSSLMFAGLLAIAAQAATITLDDRANGNSWYQFDHWMHHCQFSGRVHFTDAPDLASVECWVSGNFGGARFAPFGEDGQDRIYCDVTGFDAKPEASGPHQTQDAAWKGPPNLQVIASGYKNWSP
jgi:hypothetical protein